MKRFMVSSQWVNDRQNLNKFMVDAASWPAAFRKAATFVKSSQRKRRRIDMMSITLRKV